MKFNGHAAGQPVLHQWRRSTLSAVPTGTVLLSMMTLWSVMCTANAAGGRDHVLQVGAAIFIGRGAHGDELQGCRGWRREATSVVKLQAAGLGIARSTISFRPGS